MLVNSMNILIYLFIFILLSLKWILMAYVYNEYANYKYNIYSDSDEYLSTVELIKSKGYPAEEHQVLTIDGYILNIHRIPSSSRFESSNRLNPKPVVFLQHGLLSSSSCWVINFPEQSLGFILADRGFDVWLGNMRGNTYCQTHVKFNNTQDEFWNFSWDELAAYDLPAMIYYVINQTKQDKIFYIGHSQGTLISFAHFSQNSDLASKIKLLIGFGPVATVGHVKSPIKYLAEIGSTSNQQLWFELFGKKSFLPSNKMTDWLADKFCCHVTADTILCKNIVFVLCGPSKYLNKTRIPVYFTHDPAGTSVKNLVHYAQVSLSGKFQMFDYGSKKENIIHYNKTQPPIYDLKNIQVPVALYWAKNDWLADPADVEFIRRNLKNITDDYEIEDWDHLDFILALDARQALYERIIKLIQKYL